LDLETLGSWLIMPKILSGNWLYFMCFSFLVFSISTWNSKLSWNMTVAHGTSYITPSSNSIILFVRLPLTSIWWGNKYLLAFASTCTHVQYHSPGTAWANHYQIIKLYWRSQFDKRIVSCITFFTLTKMRDFMTTNFKKILQFSK
jgi:hypothetical protein